MSEQFRKTSTLLALGWMIVASLRAQFRMSRRDIGDLFMVIANPVYALIFMAIFVHVGREDLASYALVAPMLMGVVGTAAFVAGELVMRERREQTLEVSVICPVPFPAVIFSRILVITAISMVGIIESWLIVRFGFGIEIAIHHPGTFAAAILLTTFASAGTALIAAAAFCFAEEVRTFQNSITFPLLLFSGVLVPVTVFPDWLEPISRVVFLYWSAELLRGSMQPEILQGAHLELGVLAGLGLGSTLIGAALLNRIIGFLRREGRLGIF